MTRIKNEDDDDKHDAIGANDEEEEEEREEEVESEEEEEEREAAAPLARLPTLQPPTPHLMLNLWINFHQSQSLKCLNPTICKFLSGKDPAGDKKYLNVSYLQ